MKRFGITVSKKNIGQIIFYPALIYFSWLMILITIQYIPMRYDIAFLRIKQVEVQHFYYRVAFFTHVYTSIFVLLCGFIQFSDYIRKQVPNVHRTVGKAYILLVLFLSGPTGFIMGIYANGGWVAQISFCTLAILWISFTSMAYWYARKKQWQKHKNFMYRSYALTLSAISLRLFKWYIASAFELPPMDTYIIVSWLGWTVNLSIAELIIYMNAKKKVLSPIS